MPCVGPRGDRAGGAEVDVVGVRHDHEHSFGHRGSDITVEPIGRDAPTHPRSGARLTAVRRLLALIAGHSSCFCQGVGGRRRNRPSASPTTERRSRSKTTGISRSPRSSRTTSGRTRSTASSATSRPASGSTAKHDRVYPLTLRSVTADPASTPTDTKVSEVGNLTRIRIGDPDITVTGQHTYVITYSVEGALNHFQDHDELFWNGIGTEWDVPIEHGETIVTAPAGITQITCFSGPQGSSLPCSSSNVDGSTARFTQDGLGPFAGLTVVAPSPSGVVNRRQRPCSRSA